MAKSALIVVVTTTTLPHADDPRDCITPPITPEPEHSSQQVDHPRKRAGQCPSTTLLAQDADPAIHLAGTPTIPNAETLPIALPLDI